MSDVKLGDVLTVAGVYKKRTFWQWITRQPRELERIPVSSQIVVGEDFKVTPIGGHEFETQEVEEDERRMAANYRRRQSCSTCNNTERHPGYDWCPKNYHSVSADGYCIFYDGCVVSAE